MTVYVPLNAPQDEQYRTQLVGHAVKKTSSSRKRQTQLDNIAGIGGSTAMLSIGVFTTTGYNFMNPKRRFSQIEEVLSEALIKIDRIEDLATKTFGLSETAHTNGETTARAVANLTLEVRGIKENVQSINTKIDQVQEGQRDIMNFLREKFSWKSWVETDVEKCASSGLL